MKRDDKEEKLETERKKREAHSLDAHVLVGHKQRVREMQWFTESLQYSRRQDKHGVYH